MSESPIDNSTACAALRSLAEMRPGDGGRVETVGGETDVRRRLLEMGLTQGATVRVVRMAPLGDPIELAVRGYRLSVRRTEARWVMVQMESPAKSTGASGASAAGSR